MEVVNKINDNTKKKKKGLFVKKLMFQYLSMLHTTF